jgi:ribonuclease HI
MPPPITFSRRVFECETVMSHVRVYVDGSTPSNGKRGVPGGVGVWFGEKDRRNVSERIENATNNICELTAIMRALEQTLSDSSLNRNATHLHIYSDSMYAIECVTNWWRHWAQNGWRTAKGNSVKNQALIKRIVTLKNRVKARVTFRHVRAHTGGTDRDSVGNARADALAVRAARV